eukprot:s2059_g3.t1
MFVITKCPRRTSSEQKSGVSNLASYSPISRACQMCRKQTLSLRTRHELRRICDLSPRESGCSGGSSSLNMAVCTWQHLPSVAAWLRPKVRMRQVQDFQLGNAVAEVLACTSGAHSLAQAREQELVTFATIPPHQRSPAMAPAVRAARQQHRKATAKSWSPSSSLPVLREGVVELEAHADGVDCAVHEAWQERSFRAAVLEKPMVQALQALPGIRQHPLVSRPPPPPPRSIVPCPPCDPPHHAMRQRSAQVRRPHARQCFSMDESAKATSKRKDPKSKSCVEKTLCWTSRDARRGLLIYAA